METKRRPVPVVKEFQVKSPPASADLLEPLLPRPIYADMQEARPSQPYQLGAEVYLSGLSQQCQTQFSAGLISNAYGYYPIHQDVEFPANTGISCQKPAAEQQRIGNLLSQSNNQAQKQIINRSTCLDDGTCSFSQLQAAFGWRTNVPNQSARVQGQNNCDPLAQWNNLSFGDLLAEMPTTSVMPQDNKGPTSSILISDLNCPPQDETLASSAPMISENQEIAFATTRHSNTTCTQDMQSGAFPCQYWNTYDLNLPLSTENILTNGGRQVLQPTAGGPCQRFEAPRVADGKSLCADSSSNQQSEKAESQLTASRVDELEKLAAESLSSMVESCNPDKGVNNTDLNKTPEQKRRRKKHRPKVVSEDKPERTAKPKVPQPTNSLGTPKPKRKYTRRNKIHPPSTPLTAATPPEEAAGPKELVRAVKSSRRGLNFDLDGQVKISDSSTNSTSAAGIKSIPAVHLTQEDKLTREMAQVRSAYNLSCKVNQVLKDRITMSDIGKVSRASQEEAKANAVYESEVNGNYQPAATSSMKGQGMGTMLSKDSLETLGPNFSASASSNNGEEKMGSKRAYSYILDDMHMTNKNMNSTHGASWQSSPMYVQDSLQFPETHKKKRTEKLQKPMTSSINFTSTISEASRQKNSPQDHRRKNHTAIKHHQNCTPQLITCAAPYHQANAFGAADNSLDAMMTWEDLEKTKKKRSKVPTRVRDLASLKGFAAGRSLPANPTKPKRKYTRRKKVELPNSTPACMEALAAYSSVTHTTKKRTRKRNPSISLDQSNIHATDMQRSLVLYEDLESVRNYSGPYLPLPWKDPFSVDAITEALKRLDICRERDETGNQEHNSLVIYSTNDKAQNALVLYKKDDTMVPFKGSHDHIRKRQPRAKVHLDDETNRVWRLLLDNINNEGINGTDEEKAKWWENERSVFHGRVDSFIARMRLVQGDRRFSPWKGSVVDSCVGVFLTQNVSDHLSSSAFMSMAAQFPLKPEGEIKIDSEGNSILIEEPVDHDSSVTWTERTSDTISRTFHDTDHGEEKEVVNSKELLGGASPNHHSCSTPYLTGCHQDTHNESITAQETQTESTSGDPKGVDYVPSFQYPVVSSQNFAESPTAPTTGRVSSCSDSNSEQEDPTTSYSNLFDSTPSFVQLLKMAESPIPHEGFLHDAPSYLTYKQVKTDRKQHHKQVFAQNADCIQILDEESRSSDNLSRKDQNHSVEQSELTTDSITKFRLYNRNPYTIQKPFCPAENTCSCYVFEKEKMIIESELQSTQQDHPDLPTSSKSGCVTDNINLSVEKMDSKHTYVKPSSDKSSASAETPSILNENKTKQKKGRSRKDTKTALDWDSLRKQAQAAHGIRGRTDNTMDSLDWEAVRRADVSEIAETIKYRGMNNMLAARIKDFLDRLVREHDSIDLEWLRDVPPDKAKEYLLSIKGLGLKSVECVRLLTLHHLAFPVDTNVGRIAVRLGWVPLQPLPESLQLHLLEMYPVLESIQKYLWPRLCKLDQRTLYELHYHMITFGKVFCTKRQPNCNACPLRGECRHFASAFASARFGLPGPEEKSIMTATQSTEALHDPQVTINPLSLPEAKEHEQSEAEPKVRNCDPIIEVPASPEAEQVYISEHDIEDAFFEDPEDIPTIRLNVEQFTQTLQNYMQGNMELQEAEMSKALVALTPEAATIQIPRLKNVSRLRTEHHVYELPDNHPLLQGLDKREPDDPCSYLLAIWTPGETANSIQPPEKRCTSEGLGELCEDVTCFCCNSQREASSQIVRGTLLIPCRTAMRGSFPLNGTYFQVNEVFADHDSSITPLSIPRGLIWDLPRKTVYFGTSVPSIFRGLSTEGIQHCFWKGYVCVRGFDQKTRGPRPLMARLHFPASRRNGTKGKGREEYE